MALLFVVQHLGAWPLSPRWDWWVALGFAAPGLLDWALGRLGHRGRNGVRVLSGVFLGIALGRSLFSYFLEPASEVFWVQMALIAIAVLAVEWVRSLGLARDDESGN